MQLHLEVELAQEVSDARRTGCHPFVISNEYLQSRQKTQASVDRIKDGGRGRPAGLRARLDCGPGWLRAGRTSQLLCEQVVGRGLRRMDYQPDPATGLLTEECCDVYGVPFSVIPCRGRPVNKHEPDAEHPARCKLATRPGGGACGVISSR